MGLNSHRHEMINRHLASVTGVDKVELVSTV